jgi:hypothetical protein
MVIRLSKNSRLRLRGSTRDGDRRALVREAASGKTREKQRASTTPQSCAIWTTIAHDRAENPEKRAKKFRILITPFARFEAGHDSPNRWKTTALSATGARCASGCPI